MSGWANRCMDAMETIWTSIFSLGLMGSLFILAFQVLMWLKHSIWKPISVVTGLRWFELDWAFSPHSWFGLHDLLAFIPLSIALPVLSFLVATAFAFVVNAISEIDKETPQA